MTFWLVGVIITLMKTTSIILFCAIVPLLPYDSKLIDDYHRLTTACRGSNNAQSACLERDLITKKLLERGLCWGKEDQAEYQKKWHPCK